jgi:arylsulfatase
VIPASPGCTSPGVSLHGQGLLARFGGEHGLYRRTVQPHDGSLREIRHDLQWGRADPRAVDIAGKYSGEDNGCALSLLEPVILDFDNSIMKYPNIKRFPGGASNDLVPNLQHPEDPLPLLKGSPGMKVHGAGGG